MAVELRVATVAGKAFAELCVIEIAGQTTFSATAFDLRVLRLSGLATAAPAGFQELVVFAVSGEGTQGIDLQVSSIAGSASTGVEVPADILNIEPWTTVVLIGVGGGVSRTWAQTGGPSTTVVAVPDLSDDTHLAVSFDAPAGILLATSLFTFTADGASATVTVTTLPVTERAVVGGVEVPLRLVQV